MGDGPDDATAVEQAKKFAGARTLISGIVADVSLELLDRLSSQNRHD